MLGTPPVVSSVMGFAGRGEAVGQQEGQGGKELRVEAAGLIRERVWMEEGQQRRTEVLGPLSGDPEL